MSDTQPSHFPLYVERCHENARVPTREFPVSAGLDLYAVEDQVIPAHETRLVNIGIKMYFPSGFYGRLAPRTGLALNHGIHVNGGVIDSGYTGVLHVIMDNSSSIDFFIKTGERVAQLEYILLPNVVDITDNVRVSNTTERGANGFGRSGR